MSARAPKLYGWATPNGPKVSVMLEKLRVADEVHAVNITTSEQLHHDFPVEHRQDLKSANAVQSTFVSLRHRTTRTCNGVSQSTFVGLPFEPIEEAGKT